MAALEVSLRLDEVNIVSDKARPFLSHDQYFIDSGSSISSQRTEYTDIVDCRLERYTTVAGSVHLSTTEGGRS